MQGENDQKTPHGKNQTHWKIKGTMNKMYKVQ